MIATCTLLQLIRVNSLLRKRKINFSYNIAMEIRHKAKRHKAKLTAGSYSKCVYFHLHQLWPLVLSHKVKVFENAQKVNI